MEELIKEKLIKIKGIISDVDGVLTGGEIVVDNEGGELKIFNVKDGNAIKLWQRAGYRFAFLSGRYSEPVTKRAEELGVDLIQKSYCKIKDGEKLLEQWGLSWDEVAYIGDDFVDIPIMMKVGLPVAVGDAVEEVRDVAFYITSVPGGKGAIREVVELIMKSRGEWEKVIEKFLERGRSGLPPGTRE